MRFQPCLICLFWVCLFSIQFDALADATPQTQLTTTPNLYAGGVYFGQHGALVSNLVEGEATWLVTFDGGQWQKISWSFNPELNLNARLTVLTDQSWLAWQNERTWISRDKGKTWNNATATPDLLVGSDPLALMQLSEFGSLKISNGDIVSVELPKELNIGEIHAVSVISKTAAVAAIQTDGDLKTTAYGVIITTNAGKNWSWMVMPNKFPAWANSDYQCHHLFFLTLNEGWISSDVDHNLLHTADSGKTWSSISTPDAVVSAIYFKDPNYGRIMGSSTGRIYETNDAGKSWHELSDSDVLSPAFMQYFGKDPVNRWNSFALYRLILASSNHK